MTKLQELGYEDVTRRLQHLGFRFYRHGRGSHELWCATQTASLFRYPVIAENLSARAPCAP
jgi:predicted RNA binding protein YcfA (HicA-like mRNA interferase family)